MVMGSSKFIMVIWNNMFIMLIRSSKFIIGCGILGPQLKRAYLNQHLDEILLQVI